MVNNRTKNNRAETKEIVKYEVVDEFDCLVSSVPKIRVDNTQPPCEDDKGLERRNWKNKSIKKNAMLKR